MSYYNYGGTWGVQPSSGYAGYGGQPPNYSYSTNPSAPKPPAPPAAPSTGSSWGYPPTQQKPPPPASSTLPGSLASSFVASGSSSGSGKKTTESVSGTPSGGTSYTGYDAAVYAAATNYLANKSRGGNIDNWSKTGPKKIGGGGGMGLNNFGGGPGGSSRGGGTSKEKRAQYTRYGGYQTQQEKLQAMQEHYCEVCKISCLSAQTYQAHIQGKQHKRKEASAKSGGQHLALPANKSSYKCEICEVTCASQDTFNAHVAGKAHQKTIRLMHTLGKSVADPNAPVVIPPKFAGPDAVPKKMVGVSKINFVSGKALATGPAAGAGGGEPEEPEPVGEDYCEAKIDPHGHTVYYCKLCQCDIIDATAKDMHLKGRRHRLNYKKKVNPELAVDIKPSYYSRYNPKARKQEEALRKELMRLRQQEMASLRVQYEHEMGTIIQGRQQMVQRGPFPAMEYMALQSGNSFRLELLEDKSVMQKHREIYPTEHELTAVQRIVNNAELALKGVSDAMEEEIKKALPENADPEQAKERLLKGVMRVGDLAKGLLLKNNMNIEIVLLCSAKPTRTLLKKLFEKLQEQLKKMELTEQYAVQLNVSGASVSLVTKPPVEKPKEIKTEPGSNEKENEKKETVAEKKEQDYVKITLTIHVTSVQVREEPSSGENADPADMLPRDKCLEALASLRQAKWFQARCSNLQTAMVILRVLRDLITRVPTWTPIGPWALELLVEKVMSTTQVQLSVGEGFRRVFEAVGSGVLLAKGPGLLDPCEKEAVDASACMSPQQREDITASAQHALRLIAFGHISQVLGTEPADAPTRKRPLEQSEEKKPQDKAADKKPKTDPSKK